MTERTPDPRDDSDFQAWLAEMHEQTGAPVSPWPREPEPEPAPDPEPFTGPYAPGYGTQAGPGTEDGHLLAGHHPAGGHEGLGIHVSN